MSKVGSEKYSNYPPYTPISSLGRELGITFAFIGACLVTIAIYSVFWRGMSLVSFLGSSLAYTSRTLVLIYIPRSIVCQHLPALHLYLYPTHAELGLELTDGKPTNAAVPLKTSLAVALFIVALRQMICRSGRRRA